MKIISVPFKCEPETKMECSNGHQFWVDPHFYENLEFNGEELIAVCPICGERDNDG